MVRASSNVILQKVDDYLDGMFYCRFWVNAYGIIEVIKGLAPSSLILDWGNGDNPKNQRRAKRHDEFFVSLFHLKASFRGRGKQKTQRLQRWVFSVVGVAGFEPTTSCSQSRRDTGLRYTPRVFFRFQLVLKSRIGSANIESNNLSTKLNFEFILTCTISSN